jgi:hypothetical protein
MGMIWNSPATLDMIKLVNLQFSGDATMSVTESPNGTVPPIAYWRDNYRDLFKPGTPHDLTTIASDNSVVSPTENGNWMTWLGALGTHASGNTSPHEKLRKAIYDGLDASYAEIVFFVIPIGHGNKIKVTTPPPVDGSFLIQIETPTYDNVVHAIVRTVRKRRAKKKAARKKKA